LGIFCSSFECCPLVRGPAWPPVPCLTTSRPVGRNSPIFFSFGARSPPGYVGGVENAPGGPSLGGKVNWAQRSAQGPDSRDERGPPTRFSRRPVLALNRNFFHPIRPRPPAFFGFVEKSRFRPPRSPQDKPYLGLTLLNFFFFEMKSRIYILFFFCVPPPRPGIFWVSPVWEALHPPTKRTKLGPRGKVKF